MTPSPQAAAVLVDEIVRAGVTDACLAPGSRSAPLAVALHADDRVRLHVRHDERSAGFLALGIAKVSRRPVAVVCTSGSAAANLHPAVVEADAARVGLLLLTADRPAQLRGTGANQTIDQIKLYGGAVRWFCEVAVHEPVDVRYLRSVGSRAYAEAVGAVGGPAGPVHLNVGLPEPLTTSDPVDPTEGSRPDGGPWTSTHPGGGQPEPADLAWLTERIQATEHGLVAVGDVDTDPAPLVELAGAAGWPLLAEPQSGARRGDNAIVAYEHLLRDAPFAAAHDPDFVVVVGKLGLSKALLGSLSPDVEQVLIDRDGAWADPGRSLRRIIRADPAVTAAAVHDDLLDRTSSRWLDSWLRADAAVRAALDEVLDADHTPSEPRAARDLAAAVPDGSLLVAASSMPVRDLAMTMRPRAGLRVVANRGASGIDGFVSTALGAAAAHEGPTFALAGDLSLLHDQNGLLRGPTPRGELVVVVLNNDGGGIFSFLPQARLPSGYETLFGTPHGVDLRRLADVHELGYRRLDRAADLADAVLSAQVAGGVQVVEVRTDRSANVALHERMDAAARQVLAGLR